MNFFKRSRTATRQPEYGALLRQFSKKFARCNALHFVVLGVLLLTTHAVRAQITTILITNTAAMAGQASYNFADVVTVSAFYGETNQIPNASINSNNLDYIGVNSGVGDPNVNAINDRDTTLGGSNQERLRLVIAAGQYLEGMTWQWSRADGPLATDGVTISGFISNPGAVFSGGVLSSPAPTYSAGKLTFQITTFNSTIQTISFANFAATTNATLEITVADSTQANAQFAVRSFSVSPIPTVPKRVNLAKYQVTTASTVNGQYEPEFGTDGVVGNGNSWRSTAVTTTHTLEVAFPVAVTIRSAHVYTGIDDGLAVANFKLQYKSGASWFDVPGSSRTGNTSTEVNLIFSSAVTSDRFRFYSDDDGNVRLKELALFPPNPNPTNSVEQGFPIGTDVELNLAHNRPIVATAISGVNYPKLAVDGSVNSLSKWRTTLVGSNSLEIDLRVSTKVGSVHLYSGDTGVPPITNFVMQYWTGAAWTDFGGGVISNNTQTARVINLSPEPITSKVRLVFTNAVSSDVRELCVFPANGGTGYPLGQEVTVIAPPAQKWNDYYDAFYHLRNRAANLSASIVGSTPSLNTTNLAAESSHYQLLLNIDTDTYRLRNRVTGKCLAGAGIYTNAGALLVDEDYTAMPHQNWRKLAHDATDFYLVNEWSGLVIDTQGGGTAAETALIQNVSSGASSQRWRTILQARYPRKGSAGYVGNWSAYKSNWGYNWGREHGGTLPVDYTFNPMQWGNFNWDIGSNQGPIEQFISEWKRQDKAQHYLGFNEPDGADQSNLTVDKAIELWPRLERMDKPLLGPATKNPFVLWQTDFMNEAENRGYRIDGMAVHKYPGPNGGDPSSLISELQSVNTTWGLPVWFTEFSTVDWGGTATWTEEDNYNWLAEFMWRAESLTWLRRYSLFLFTADANNPVPANPEDTVAPRSNAFQSNGSTPTSFGELYFAWDCDANVRGDKAYFIHNKGERKRVRNAVGSTVPDHGNIREGTNTTQWVLRAAPTPGQWYISSLRDGRLLRYSGGVVDFAPMGTTGAAVGWTLVEDQHGWFYIENPAAPASNRRLKDLAGAFSMVSNANTGDAIKWRFVVPFAPVSTALPVAPVNLNAFASANQVSLTWGSGGTPNTTYWVYRSTNSGGAYSLIASNRPSITYLDTTALGGLTYYYVVTAKDAIGNESPYSNQASATPTLPSAPTNINYAVSNNSLVLNWPVNYTGWLLQVQTNSLAVGLNTNWMTIPGSQSSNTFQSLFDSANPGVFYRLKLP